MLESSIIYFILRSIPESITLILSGYILLGVDIKKNIINILKEGIALGLFIYIVRTLPINFGIHTVLAMIIQGIMLYKISNKNIVQLMISTCQIWLSVILSEAIYIVIALKVLSLDLNLLTNNKNIESAIATLPSLIILISIVFIFRYLNKKTILKGWLKCQ